jgi:SAM-dependent methyltransferase
LTAGPLGTLRSFKQNGRTYLSGLRNRVNDARFGVDTMADQPDPEVPSEAAHDDARPYGRVSPRVFGALMRDMPRPQDATFIDIGCGKGAALLLALDYGFRSLVGIELNGRLVPIARANLATYAARRGIDYRADVQEVDATRFRFPTEPSVVFLFNPFGAETLREVLDNLEASLERTPRDVVVAYMNPFFGGEFDGRPAFRPVPTTAPYCAVWRSAGGTP